MVFYLKYRPQTINELDSKQVRDALSSVLSLPSIPHAFLFTGPKGLGKTSAARILAKAVNCLAKPDLASQDTNSNSKNQISKIQIKNKKLEEENTSEQIVMGKGQNLPAGRQRAMDKGQGVKSEVYSLNPKLSVLSLTTEPCNKCEQCISITNGTNLDILEIDAASNRGIDEIRDLREKIRLSPVAAAKKVYIIDEVHMLTTEAFNALLKTLEEPPAHAMFILCTTELAKVPTTIVSRCFQIHFTPANSEDIARSFSRIAKGEELDITQEAIEQISELAEGGFRDAHKILEELVAMGEKNITQELVEKRYKHTSSKNQVWNLIKSLEKRNVKEGLHTIQSVVAQGIDIKQFVMQLNEAVHQLMLDKAGIKQDLKYKMHESKLSIHELRELLILLNTAHTDMKFAVLPQLPLELAVVEWSGMMHSVTGATSVIPAEAGIQSGNAAGSQISSIRQAGGSGVTDKQGGDAIPDIPSESGKSDEQIVVQKHNVSVSESAQISNNGITVSSMRKQVGDIARVKVLYGEKKETTVDNKPQIRDFSLLNVSNTELTKEWIDNFWHVYISEIKQYNHTIAGVLRSCRISKLDKEILVITTAYKFHKDKLSEGKTKDILENVCKALTGKVMKVEVELKQ